MAEGKLTNVNTDGNCLYIYDEKQQAVFEIAMGQENLRRMGYLKTRPLWVGRYADNNLLVCEESGIIYQINNRGKKKKKVAKIAGEVFLTTDCKCAGEYFYYYTSEMELYRVNISSGGQEKLISFSELSEAKEKIKTTDYSLTQIHYCSDYIAIEFDYDREYRFWTSCHKDIFLFDYNGTFIKYLAAI